VRRALAFFGLLACFAPGLARADARQACVAAADSGQTQRDQGKLVEAKESFVACARDVCPAVVANQCATWLAEVSRDIPTVSLRATDASGKELIDVQVLIDGTTKLEALDGRATPINPGVHRLRFAHAGDADAEQEVLVHVGDRARPIEGHFGGNQAGVAPRTDVARSPEAQKASFRFPLLAGVSFGVSAVSCITMGVLVGTTASDVNHLRATCAGSCSQSEVDSANTRVVVANVAMGLGIVAAATGLTSLLVVNLGHHEVTSGQALSFGVGPGSVQLRGVF